MHSISILNAKYYSIILVSAEIKKNQLIVINALPIGLTFHTISFEKKKVV